MKTSLTVRIGQSPAYDKSVLVMLKVVQGVLQLLWVVAVEPWMQNSGGGIEANHKRATCKQIRLLQKSGRVGDGDGVRCKLLDAVDKLRLVQRILVDVADGNLEDDWKFQALGGDVSQLTMPSMQRVERTGKHGHVLQ